MDDLNISRRSLIESLGSVGIGLTLAGCADTAIAGTGAVTNNKAAIPAVPRRVIDRSMWGKRPRATFKKTGNFDLSNPNDLNLARMKVLGSINGDKAYLYTISRHILCPEGKPPYPLFAEMELTTVWLERDDSISKDEAFVCAYFTRAAVDPTSFKPIDQYNNPYLGRTIEVKDTLFGGSGSKIDMGPNAPPNPITQNDDPHFRLGGDEISFILFDPRSGEGAFQPRIDTVVWSTSYRDLMDPETRNVRSSHSYSAVLKASAYPWSGITKSDPAQMLTMKTGTKVNSLADLPKEFQDRLVSRYPERM